MGKVGADYDAWGLFPSDLDGDEAEAIAMEVVGDPEEGEKQVDYKGTVAIEKSEAADQVLMKNEYVTLKDEPGGQGSPAGTTFTDVGYITPHPMMGSNLGIGSWVTVAMDDEPVAVT